MAGGGALTMADLRLPKLPDRTSVKLTISITPDLAADLALYSELYRRSYACEEPVSELIPAIIRSFLDADRAFVRARREASVPPPP